jgi:hypothetical protein
MPVVSAKYPDGYGLGLVQENPRRVHPARLGFGCRKRRQRAYARSVVTELRKKPGGLLKLSAQT